MAKKLLVRAYLSNPDNIVFVALLDELGGYGVTQQQVSDRLEISPAQLSRVKNGERHAARKHITSLRDFVRDIKKERKNRAAMVSVGAVRQSLFSIDQPILRRLSVKESVEAFRDLLWARATSRGIPRTVVNVSSEVFVSDGGVDASVADTALPGVKGDELLSNGTRFQIKTGDFAPWQPSVVKAELFGKKAQTFENLGSAIQTTLRDSKRFVFVCFGVDPVDKDLRKARENIQAAFAKCGFPNANVEVWGQSQLIGLFREYPSLCLRLMGHDHDGFRSLRSWSLDADMQPATHYSVEQQLLIEQLRSDLGKGSVGHLRLIGEPGIGKTRLALEIARCDEFAPVTLYVKDGRTLLSSSFINELVQSDDHRYALLVVDECTNKDRADIWNILKHKRDRIRIISIDHGPDTSADELMRVLEVEPTGVDQIVAILMSHGIGKDDARRWAGFCEGCPRVAHVLGENLRLDRPDLLQAPGTVDVWDRFILGHDLPNSEEATIRELVLTHVSLFERFGFESPVDSEARFIAALAQACNPSLTWGRFQATVRALQQRRILQGSRTLYITPRLLHIHLYRRFWDNYGNGLNLASSFSSMPKELWNWFVRMLRYAHDSETAMRAIDALLDDETLFPANQFPNAGESGRIIEVISETSPRSTLRCLRRTIGGMDVDALRKLSEPRQLIVWALEKIAVWNDCFDGAARLLLRLAEAENASHSNNATGTFIQLFSLIPSMAMTQAAPSARLRVLQDALESKSSETRRIALEACVKAIDTSNGFRTVGPEHQGLRKTIECWMPKTYGELWDAHKEIWHLLVSKLDVWGDEDRSRLVDAMISAAWSTIHIPPLAQSVLDLLKRISGEPNTNLGSVTKFVKRQLRNEESNLPDEIKAQLKEIGESLEGHDFPTKLRRYVKFITWEDYHDDSHNQTDHVGKVLDQLADEAWADKNLLLKELPWLVCEHSNTAYHFAYRLSTRDRNGELLELILTNITTNKSDAAIQFLGGYLAAVFQTDRTKWDSIIEQLADNPSVADRLSDFVISSGMSDGSARQVIELCHQGKHGIDRLERWWFATTLRLLSADVIRELIVLQQEAGSGQMWRNAIQMCHTYYLEKGSEKTLPEDLAFDLLTHESMADARAAHSVAYYWSRLAEAFVGQYPKRKWELFERVLRVGLREWSVLGDLNSYGEGLLTRILRGEPDMAFACIVRVLNENQGQSLYGIQRWLSQGGPRTIGDDAPGPIQFIPSKLLFDWVDADIEDRADWLAMVLPKTLDDSVAGRLTRDFVARYGNERQICSSLYVQFHSRGWCGNASDHYRKLRDEARGWLVDEREANVIRWVEDYIEGLSRSIEEAEIEEEREF